MDGDWVFDAGRPCLDLVNTVRSRHAQPVELLTGPGKLAEWLGLAGFTLDQTSLTGGNLIAAKALREAVDRLVVACADGLAPRTADVQLLNEAAVAAPAPVPELWIDDDGGPHRRPRPVSDPVAAAFATLAVDAIDLVTGEVAVRICAADDCGLRFCDASPRRTRQWCSMARCGNRAKARAHYARIKSR
ncbi:CGNR zinc finger domain-containing protein [Amycolatopsis sp. H20-H5]|uniref:CGNR zinc finger domain-containing protein n=1 Tax=Amycolatopsis sp. H20-H5 TaxID=3046309 RepID=UPI002DB9575C|nr:ABATE domain-containing protein [Amycolatopsis sp. H20-H5]MEC3975406.1 ABATE domain-containing protein [Amycolatopsis sp. H20-H5]